MGHLNEYSLKISFEKVTHDILFRSETLSVKGKELMNVTHVFIVREYKNTVRVYAYFVLKNAWKTFFKNIHFLKL